MDYDWWIDFQYNIIEREVAEYKMKIHTMEAELEKLNVRLERAVAEKVRHFMWFLNFIQNTLSLSKLFNV